MIGAIPTPNPTMRRGLILTGVILLGVLLASCEQERGLPPDQMDLVAWYIEDVAHGNARDPGELVLPDAGEAMSKIAIWLAGGQVRDQHIPPKQLETRRDRWPALRSLFLQGQVVALEDGLVAPSPGLDSDDRLYVLPVVDAENHDRRNIDALVIGLSAADHAAARHWLGRSSTARHALDLQHGAKAWEKR
jgi:hypothetical protein